MGMKNLRLSTNMWLYLGNDTRCAQKVCLKNWTLVAFLNNSNKSYPMSAIYGTQN